MNKTSIEWCDYSANPVKGLCPVGCSYCYARRMYKRFHWDETIRYDPGWSVPISRLKKPSRIFVGSTMELFGPWLEDFVVDDIIKDVGRDFPQHTFIFLTKRPQELAKYNPWPDNCWVGMTIDGRAVDINAPFQAMGKVQARVKFVSFEPLLEGVCQGWGEPFKAFAISWVIIGQETPIRKPIPPSWIADIELSANKAGIPVFHKDNLGVRLGARRREFPLVRPMELVQ